MYLSGIDPTIIQSVRYFTVDNFVGRAIKGYENPKIIMTSAAAKALKNAQKELNENGYSLVVYDAYRPQEAVDSFVKWAADLNDNSAKAEYYPTTSKEDLFTLGYIAAKSGHTRGSTIDLTIIPTGEKIQPIKVGNRILSNGEVIPFLDDGTVDMGSSFDLFHPVSNHDTNLVSEEVIKQRNFLRAIMKKHDFKEYHEEWWHYTLANEPFPDTYFNFKVE